MKDDNWPGVFPDLQFGHAVAWNSLKALSWSKAVNDLF